jgi:hypothetical protein
MAISAMKAEGKRTPSSDSTYASCRNLGTLFVARKTRNGSASDYTRRTVLGRAGKLAEHRKTYKEADETNSEGEGLSIEEKPGPIRTCKQHSLRSIYSVLNKAGKGF